MENFRFLWAPILIFIIGYLLLRIAGKRAVASMSTFDLFVVSAMGSTLGGFLIHEQSFPRTVGATAILVLTYLGFSYLVLNNKARRFIVAKPSVVIYKGHINEQGLKTARLTVDELLGQLRLKGMTAVSDVEFAILEEAGELSVIPKAQARAVSPRDLHLPVPPVNRPVPVVIDGEWIEENLISVKRGKKYVIMQLQQQGVAADRIGSLTLVTVDQQGQVWHDVFETHGSQYRSESAAETGVLQNRSQDATVKNKMEK